MQRRSLVGMASAGAFSVVAALGLASPANAELLPPNDGGCALQVSRNWDYTPQVKDRMTITSDGCPSSYVVRLWVEGRTCATDGLCASTWYPSRWIRGTGAWATVTLDITEVFESDHYDLSADGGRTWTSSDF